MTGKSMFRAILALSTVAVLLVLPVVAGPASDPDAGTGEDAEIYAMNTDKTDPASLIVDFVSLSGSSASSAQSTINPMGRAWVSTESEVTTSPWLGSAVLYASEELASMAKIRWSGGTANDGVTQGAYTGFRQGSTELFIPNLFMRRWMYSTIAVQNLGATDADFHINYYSRGEATPFAQVVDPNVPADANRYYDLKYTQRSTDPSKIPTFVPSNDWLGAAVISSTNDIAAVVTTHWDNYAAIYQGVAAEEADYQIYAPSVFKRRFRNWFSYTAVLVQNTENTSATIHFMLYDRDGNLDLDFWETIDPMSATGFNTRYGGDSPGERFYDLGFDWLGSAVISSTTKIAVEVNTLWPDKVAATSYNALAPSLGTAEVFLPHMRKLWSGTWIEYCGAIVQNLSDQTNNVDVYVYPTAGGTDWNDYLMHQQVAVDPWSSFGINTRYGAEWDTIPNDWAGTIYLSGEYNIGAIVNCPRNDSAFSYNGTNQ